MHGLRSLPRVACAIGCAWLLLDSVPSLASFRPNGIEIMDINDARVYSGNYIEAQASVNYQHKTGTQRIYTKLPVQVAKSTLRVGALSALSRGVMHPGFQIAIAAAGFAYSQINGQYEITKPYSGESQISDVSGYNGSNHYYSGGNTYSSYLIQDKFVDRCFQPGWSCQVFGVNTTSTSMYVDYKIFDADNDQSGISSYAVSLVPPSDNSLPGYESPSQQAISDADLLQLDEHVPPELLSQLYDRDGNVVDVPPWEEQISVMGMSGAQSNGNVMPEVMSSAKSWGQNIAAKLEGEQAPNPDTKTEGDTAQDAAYKQQQEEKNTPPPPFADVEVEWQTEEITDIPSWSSGIGSGSCPAPVEFSMSGQTVGFDYEPVCRAAIAINPFFLGFCGLMALYIVLGRQRAGG